jgi:type VI protein secretion system component VasF
MTNLDKLVDLQSLHINRLLDTITKLTVLISNLQDTEVKTNAINILQQQVQEVKLIQSNIDNLNLETETLIKEYNQELFKNQF